ncbi:MAG: nucleotide pyrophosphohydrolase [Bacteroidetes bacterium OLB9]|nr:MAG: nucleotide pyrophosphohydrolase [Bacteroidetes bacterium OLB9]MCZ2338351.1 nucleoside triphosphate pyrophosphohydrolase [Chitinophagales bacterium]
MNTTRAEKLEAFGRLLDIMDDLRAQCPWDKKQTMESLRILTIEEMYELSDAILSRNMKDIKEEIGDLMLHMVFYSKIGSETDDFDVASVLQGICDKLVKRHPHIYGDVKVEDEADVKRNWEQLKLAEGKKSVLGGVPNGLPAMVKAYRMQEKTAQVGFQWKDKLDVWDKVEEEIQEFRQVAGSGDATKIEEEFGDVLFSLINYARYIKVNPETALERVNRKFKSRFEYIESHADKPLADMTLDEMDMLWNKAKKIEGK